MADTKLSALNPRNALLGTDVVYVVDPGTGLFYKSTVDVLVAYARTNMYPQVATFADLPVSTGSGNIYIVQGSTGIWPVRKYAGFWRDTGTGWVWLGNATWVAGEIGFTPTGNIAATDVAGALAELDSEKAAAASLAAVATSGAYADLTGKPALAAVATSGSEGDLAPGVQSVASAATVTPTFANNQVEITAQAVGLTIANPTGTAVPGRKLVVRIKDNGSPQTIAYGTQFRAIGVTMPLTTVAGKTLYLGFIYNSADTKWDCVAVAQEA